MKQQQNMQPTWQTVAGGPGGLNNQRPTSSITVICKYYIISPGRTQSIDASDCLRQSDQRVYLSVCVCLCRKNILWCLKIQDSGGPRPAITYYCDGNDREPRKTAKLIEMLFGRENSCGGTIERSVLGGNAVCY